MGYIEASLLPDEQLVYRAKLHWKIFVKPVCVVLLGLAAFALQPVLGAVVLAVGLAMGVKALIEYASSEFGVTTKRVIIKVGFLRRQTIELLLRQVEAIAVDQTVLGRILDFGSVTLTGTGDIKQVFHNISSPLEFRRRIHAQEASGASGRI
ncbi:MAG TPA: PH domain-containing protein [candidate division Zixibacteria bacterium]|nr:PH domain-containing protein [candidate division Zixibacteria bacterium]